MSTRRRMDEGWCGRSTSVREPFWPPTVTYLTIHAWTKRSFFCVCAGPALALPLVHNVAERRAWYAHIQFYDSRFSRSQMRVVNSCIMRDPLHASGGQLVTGHQVNPPCYISHSPGVHLSRRVYVPTEVCCISVYSHYDIMPLFWLVLRSPTWSVIDKEINQLQLFLHSNKDVLVFNPLLNNRCH